MRSLLFILFFLSARPAFASSCGEVDLRNDNQLLLQARNQGKSEWCYAYAAADLLSYRLGAEVSASDVALNYTGGVLNTASRRFFGASEFDAKRGFIEGALKDTMRKGMCLESQFHSDDYAGFVNDEVVLRTMNEEIQALEKNAGMRQRISDILAEPNTPDELKCRDLRLVPGLKEARALFPMLSFAQSLSIYLDAKSWNVVRKFQSAACRERKSFPVAPKIRVVGCENELTCASFTGTKRDSLLEAIDHQLDRRDMAAIGYDVSKLGIGVMGLHASTVAGRRVNPISGKCDYLVRDNTGAKDLCAFYGNPTYDCDRAGYIWIPAPRLKEAVNQVVFLE